MLRLHECNKQAANRGFSLVELLVVLVVLGIVMAIAVPSFTSMINRNKLSASANELVAGMQIAKSEAVRRNGRVVVCPSTDNASCSGSNWANLIIFADNDADGSVDSGEELIRAIQVTTGELTVTSSTNVATNNRIAFSADGFARVGNAGARTGAIGLCSTKVPAAENTRDVSVSVGRIGVASRNGTASCTAPAN
ncbi:GspH/FimT family pseudopilin [Lysobacter sp. LF1]|uniref:Type II secretion system protein H n=1 Tax=Lysobacter stagni TaxID=3045172 RepID=A0ABT6XKU3_9GAMM|nr:GspH/FimT family pseudopilin [Lysobacter sp. LF1]MDI9240790.1 GspH/FimT family pseudopilin [Lysobacter sp. LF1]